MNTLLMFIEVPSHAPSDPWWDLEPSSPIALRQLRDCILSPLSPGLGQLGTNSGPWARNLWAKEGLPRWISGKESTCQFRRHRFDPWVGKIHWRRKRQPTPVFLLGLSYGQKSLEGCSPWGHNESDLTQTHTEPKKRGSEKSILGNGVGDGAQTKSPVSWGRREKGLVPFITSGSPISRC